MENLFLLEDDENWFELETIWCIAFERGPDCRSNGRWQCISVFPEILKSM